ncbi:hypothetical protein Pst134EB_019926 [Puccinia striiformis f. sp. tritici]|nr:hypothetical protein Pst134EB_019926 [Puccinia striiformis f. sp. tritici]
MNLTLSHQTPVGYEARIRQLEGFVHLLLAKLNLADHGGHLPLFSMAPMASSFRYSIKRGLEPVLPNKIAMSLAADWRIGRAIGRKNFSSPPRRQPLVQSSSFHARKIDRLSLTVHLYTQSAHHHQFCCRRDCQRPLHFLQRYPPPPPQLTRFLPLNSPKPPRVLSSPLMPLPHLPSPQP